MNIPSLQFHISRATIPRLTTFYSKMRISMFHSTAQSNMKASMQSIKELRKRTGAPISAVKKALEEQSGDIDAAIDHLRKLGANIAAKKAHREASEGLVGIAISEDIQKAVILELNSETDFVARNVQFGNIIHSLSNQILHGTAPEEGSSLQILNVDEVLTSENNRDMLSDAVTSLGENIVLKRISYLQTKMNNGGIYGYVHGALGESRGRIGVVVALEGVTDDDIGSRIAMHIAAAAPSYASIDAIPAEEAQREREILIEAAKAEQKPGSKPKPEGVFQKVADGRLKKWYSSVALEEQEMLVEPPSYSGKPRTVKESLVSQSDGARIVSFARFAVGEKLDTPK